MNTPDTEVEYNMPSIQIDGVAWIRKIDHDTLLTSRDTYWKERVKQVSHELVKEFRNNLITIAIENEHLRGCVTSNQINDAFKDFEASTHSALDTLLDNLK